VGPDDDFGSGCLIALAVGLLSFLRFSFGCGQDRWHKVGEARANARPCYRLILVWQVREKGRNIVQPASIIEVPGHNDYSDMKRI
jgi:hypothetical protein